MTDKDIDLFTRHLTGCDHRHGGECNCGCEEFRKEVRSLIYILAIETDREKEGE